MTLRIDKQKAIELLRAEAKLADRGSVDASWVKKVEELSRLCEVGISKTHIAFLGTAMLAKAMHLNADLFAIKPEHAGANPNSFSARTLCHGVLVPLAAELGFSLGVTGREPLNNQPYFRMTRLDDKTPVHAGGRAAFDFMVKLTRELQSLSTPKKARAALRAFIVVRRRYQPRYVEPPGEVNIKPDELLAIISAFVQEQSENGKRAQAVVAGLMDAFAGPDRVQSGRINDPSRRYPGDVCVRSAANPREWEKAIEVRDKPVTTSDARIFGKKCVDMGVREAALVMVAESQVTLEEGSLASWANEFGIGLTLFYGWDSFAEQALFWAGDPKPIAAIRSALFIYRRLIAVEASMDSVQHWQELVRSK